MRGCEHPLNACPWWRRWTVQSLWQSSALAGGSAENLLNYFVVLVCCYLVISSFQSAIKKDEISILYLSMTDDVIQQDWLGPQSNWAVESFPTAPQVHTDHHWESSCLYWSPCQERGESLNDKWMRPIGGETSVSSSGLVDVLPDGGGGWVSANSHLVLPLSDLLSPVWMQPCHTRHMTSIHHGHYPVFYTQLTGNRQR